MAEVEAPAVSPDAVATETAPEAVESEPALSEPVTAVETQESEPAVSKPVAAIETQESEPAVLEPVAAVETQESEPAVSEPVAAVETQEIPPVSSDHKRKHDELESEVGIAEKPEVEATSEVPAVAAGAELTEGSDDVNSTTEKAQEIAPEPTDDAAGGAKRLRLNGETDGLVSDGGQQVQKLEAPLMGNGQVPPTENFQHAPSEELQQPTAVAPQPDNIPSVGQQPVSELPTSTRQIEVPNNKVGVLIGKAGDTIRFLQYNSGAKIQITRDSDADPYSSTRLVELIGSLENINKAEQLIKDVIAEADAGGSPALIARGFSAARSGSEQLEIQVPNEKVGSIIGKGGETIKNLQTRSGARIQLIPQHLPEGDVSKERTVRVTGNKKQIETATEMIKEAMNQVPVRSSSHSGGYNQQIYRPRGPTVPSQWGSRAMPPTQQTMGYGYQQRGMYPSQTTQYPTQTYGGYPQQPPQRGSFNTGWDQRPIAPSQTSSQASGYDYYGQGGQPTDTHPSGPGLAPASAVAAAPTPAPVNYNYGHSQAPGYGQPTSYPQSMPTQQSYGHGYDEPKYDGQAPTQQVYGQPPVSSQPGAYAQQVNAPQSGYTQQQPYNKPPYGGLPSQGLPPQSYGPPRTSQPGDGMYQGPIQSSYASGGPTQQPYPYGSNAPSQPAAAYAQPYGPTSGTTDGYVQPSLASYAQQSSQGASTYPQSGQSGGYGQYPATQPSYGEQPVPNNPSYGYQAGPTADAGYGNNVPSSGYGVPPPAGGQVGYVQPRANPTGYDQSMAPQPGYGSLPASGQVGYTKSLSPQPVYGQYDSAQMYGHH